MNYHFLEKHDLYHIAEVIVDKAQLNHMGNENVDLRKPTRTIHQLLRHPDVKKVVEHYVDEGGYFAVTTDRKKTRFMAIKPEGSSIRSCLEKDEERFMNALSNVRPYKKSESSKKFLENMGTGGAGGLLLGIITNPELEKSFMNHIGRIASNAQYPLLDAISYLDAGDAANAVISLGYTCYGLMSDSLQFLLSTEEGHYVAGGAMLYSIGREALRKDFWRSLNNKMKGRGKKNDDILELLLDEAQPERQEIRP
ncbi:MAG: hypothetical protein ABIG84_01660 [archaeon]